MATYNFTGTYTSTDGKFTLDLDRLPYGTLMNAFVKQADHVFGNEAISKASTAKGKAGVVGDDYTEAFTEAMYDEIIAGARADYAEAMYNGTWGEKGVRKARTPGATRLETIFNMILAKDTRAALATAQKPKGTEDDTWLTDNGDQHPLSAWMKSYLDNEKFGADRRASIEKRAQAQLDAEKIAAEERKAAKAREAGAATAGGLSI